MSEAQVPILSREWWLTVFFVGLAIHLLASYLKPLLDAIGGRFFRSWAMRTEVRARKRMLRVGLIKEDETARQMAAHREVRHRLVALTFLALTALLATIYFAFEFVARQHNLPRPLPLSYKAPEAALLLSILFSLFAVMDNHRIAANITSELREANEED